MADSKIAVYGALAANVGIAVVKFIAAGVTGSSAMLSEAIHSAVDTGNQILMLVGLHRSKQAADSLHPFGHGRELYFWNLLVAVMIFGAGGGISIYQGVLHVLHPATIENPKWTYTVLGIAFLFEGASLWVALRQFNSRPERLIDDIIASKDPTTYTVIAEDSSALAGVVIAAAGVFASGYFDMPALDGVASIAIGVLLAGVAIFLVRESHGLLVGEGVDPRAERAIAALVRETPTVRSVSRPLTMYLGPQEALLTVDVNFEQNVSAVEIAGAIKAMEGRIRQRFPDLKRIYIEAST